jgi:phosphatidylserine/phosphatidylglycerophosphate/cardiolipin synthase-like enzyme
VLDSARSAQTPAPEWEVCFTPPPGCTSTVVKALGNARSSVLVQAYTFTSAPIAKALLDAHRRGVKVDVILDRASDPSVTPARIFWRVLGCR